MATSPTLTTWFPRTSTPFISNAPMFSYANARLATAVTQAGGFGFIGGGYDFSDSSTQIQGLSEQLDKARRLLSLTDSDQTLPVGVGFITFRSKGFVENIVPVIEKFRPAAVWLFAPAVGESHHQEIIKELGDVGKNWDLKIFVQVGDVRSAKTAVQEGADVIVVQGVDAGGHQWAQGASLMTLLPEVKDALGNTSGDSEVKVIAAGGIMDGRGIAAALALGADGVVMGTRFVATEECPGPDPVKAIMVATKDGSQTTIKSTVHDDIQGTGFWPEPYNGRAIAGTSYKDHMSGLSLQENALKHRQALQAGDFSRKIVWAGAGVGLIKSILSVKEVIDGSQAEARAILQRLR